MDKMRDFFKDFPGTNELFDLVANYIDRLGKIETEVTKSQISFGAKRKFAWVWLPQKWIKKAPQSSIVLTIGLRRQINDQRIKEVKEPYPGRFVHHIVLHDKNEFDEAIQLWLKEAYEDSL